MKRWLLMGLLATNVTAQVFRPVDVNQRADVQDKNLTLPTASFPTLSQDTREFSLSPLSNQQRQFNDAPTTKPVDLKFVEHPTITKSTLAQTNVTTATAGVTDKKHETKAVPSAKAPINQRQIRAYTPAGEEELKKQLREPH